MQPITRKDANSISGFPKSCKLFFFVRMCMCVDGLAKGVLPYFFVGGSHKIPGFNDAGVGAD